MIKHKIVAYTHFRIISTDPDRGEHRHVDWVQDSFIACDGRAVEEFVLSWTSFLFINWTIKNITNTLWSKHLYILSIDSWSTISLPSNLLRRWRVKQFLQIRSIEFSSTVNFLVTDIDQTFSSSKINCESSRNKDKKVVTKFIHPSCGSMWELLCFYPLLRLDLQQNEMYFDEFLLAILRPSLHNDLDRFSSFVSVPQSFLRLYGYRWRISLRSCVTKSQNL